MIKSAGKRPGGTPREEAVDVNAVELLSRRWTKWALFFLLWTMPGLFEATQSYIARAMEGKPLPWWRVLSYGLVDWYMWGLMAPIIFHFSRRFPLEHGHWRRWLTHVFMSALCSVVVVAVDVRVLQAARPSYERHVSNLWLFYLLFISRFNLYLLIYWTIVGFSHGLSYYHRYRERQKRATQLEGLLAQARLEALKMQLHPHFLFNTLHAISSLMHRDVELADRMISRLGALLRIALENPSQQEVPLQEELEFVCNYLEIEQARLGSRLTVDIDIDPAVMDARVPNLILQPIVENAIRHGIAPQPGAGRIEISARRHDSSLQLLIRDTGPGLPSGGLSAVRQGIGVRNTRARLDQLYGEQQSFTLENHPKGGVVVAMAIPFRTDEERRFPEHVPL